MWRTKNYHIAIGAIGCLRSKSGVGGIDQLRLLCPAYHRYLVFESPGSAKMLFRQLRQDVLLQDLAIQLHNQYIHGGATRTISSRVRRRMTDLPTDQRHKLKINHQWRTVRIEKPAAGSTARLSRFPV